MRGRVTVIINGLRLPSSFVEAVHQGKLRRSIGSWPLLKDVDAYGNHLETVLGEVYEDEEAIAKVTLDLPAHFEPDGYYGNASDRESEPGAIADITTFSEIICFGMSGDGAPFCFDFRSNPHQ